MKVARFSTTPDGGSMFDDIEISLQQQSKDAYGNQIATSERFDSPGVRIFEINGDFQDWHNAPQQQLCVVLEGQWQVTTTDGESRTWGPGEMFVPYDVEGKGHQSRVLENPVRILFVPLPSDFDITHWQQSK